jgi:hypothetical protein
MVVWHPRALRRHIQPHSGCSFVLLQEPPSHRVFGQSYFGIIIKMVDGTSNW